MRWPSGDQTRFHPSVSAFWVRLVGLVPSAAITYTSALPSRLDAKAMRWLSGDQTGAQSSLAFWVRLVAMLLALLRLRTSSV